MFVAGHGGNHPVVSNATAAGRERNRRIELVIYPEQVGGR
jgi:outer membrane protein OmpA-like peptidoglycan-associated protein